MAFVVVDLQIRLGFRLQAEGRSPIDFWGEAGSHRSRAEEQPRET
jgi:hypothetical protein